MAHTIRILHISDLHRSVGHPVTNTVVRASLLKDRERLGIQNVDLLVVSGDIVWGAIDVESIHAQYDEAEQLLAQLAKDFVDGEKNRVVVVPGNHDVSWPASRSAMRVRNGETKLLSREAMNPSSRLRWSWDEARFYEIVDELIYASRFQEYANFYERFYEKKRSYSLDASNQFEVFDFPSLNLTVVGFNSCDRNDHLNVAGRISPDAIARVGDEFRARGLGCRLKLAVWHHNTNGLPTESNYLDWRILENLADHEFLIGLHGHQHRADVLSQVVTLLPRSEMAVVSAGSLCAGPEDLPSGERKGYNWIELTISDGKLEIAVVPRDQKSSTPEAPVWGTGSVRGREMERIDIALPVPAGNLASRTYEAERLATEGNWRESLRILEQLNPLDPFVHMMRVEALAALGRYSELAALIEAPASVSEGVHLLEALRITKQWKRLSEVATELLRTEDPSLRAMAEKSLALSPGEKK